MNVAGQIVDLSVERDSRDREKRRQELIAELTELARQDVDAICQLDDYCRNRRRTVDDRVRSLLIGRGLLAENGTLPDLTNEAMYWFRTGQKPFWLNADRP